MKKPTTFFGWLVAVFAGLGVLTCACVGLSVAVVGSRGTAAAAPTQQAAVAATAVPTEAPTVTPEPTSKPTATRKPAPTVAIPTNTLVPASAPAGADVGADVRTYFGVVAPKLGTFGQALSTFGELLQHPQIGDTTWTIKAAAAIYVMNTTHQELRDLAPIPAPAQSFHAALLDATEDCSDAGSLVAKAIDSADVALITQAGALMERCNTKVNTAAPMLDALVAEYGK